VKYAAKNPWWAAMSATPTMLPSVDSILICSVYVQFQTEESKKWMSVPAASARGMWLRHPSHRPNPPGNAKVSSKPKEQKVLRDNKIPNLKHQITNKSQISIFNDQNIHQRCIEWFRKPSIADNDAG
jgi:hypothetical protein